MPPHAPHAVDVLVLVAHRLELAGFGDVFALEPSTQRTPVVTLHGLRVSAAVVGVGVLAAGAGAARALDARPACGALLLGSFGAYPRPGAPAIGALLVPDQLRAVDVAVLRGHAAVPEAMPQRSQCSAALADGLTRVSPDASRGAVATTLGITTDDGLAHELGASAGCTGENLEAVAVALACEVAAVPFAALLACTNEVGARGRAQWLANHRAAAAETARVFRAWLAAGAPGLPPA